MIDPKETSIILPTFESETVSDKVYKYIKKSIVSGLWKPGERIIQETITKQLNISRSPVRDALQRLSSEGLVVITPFRGAEVFELSKTGLNDLYDLRILLEAFAAEKSLPSITKKDILTLERLNSEFAINDADTYKCMQFDRAFHALLCKATKETYTGELLENLWDKCDLYKSIYYSQDGNVEKTVHEHNQIIQAFKANDKEAVKDALSGHLTDVVRQLSKTYQLND